MIRITLAIYKKSDNLKNNFESQKLDAHKNTTYSDVSVINDGDLNNCFERELENLMVKAK